MLTQEQLKERLEYNPETGIFIYLVSGGGNSIVGTIAGCVADKGYIRIKVLGSSYRAHRLAWLYMYGVHPKQQIDHRNGIKSDNRLCNLREASGHENRWNRKTPKNNKSGHKCVIFRKERNKWSARCRLNDKLHSLGCFIKYEDAVAVYQDFSKKHHGEFCNLG